MQLQPALALCHALQCVRGRGEDVNTCMTLQEQRKEYDVYVNDPQPLDEGEEKHVISAFVADESGMINRVAGVFARRGGLASFQACTCVYVCLHGVVSLSVDDVYANI